MDPQLGVTPQTREQNIDAQVGVHESDGAAATWMNSSVGATFEGAAEDRKEKEYEEEATAIEENVGAEACATTTEEWSRSALSSEHVSVTAVAGTSTSGSTRGLHVAVVSGTRQRRGGCRIGGDHAGPGQVPDGPRSSVNESTLYYGVLSSWWSRGPNGFGWIKPVERIDHPAAKMHKGKVFVSSRDIERGVNLEDQVSFRLYVDKKGLGATDCRRSAFSSQGPTGATPSVAPRRASGSSWYGRSGHGCSWDGTSNNWRWASDGSWDWTSTREEQMPLGKPRHSCAGWKEGDQQDKDYEDFISNLRKALGTSEEFEQQEKDCEEFIQSLGAAVGAGHSQGTEGDTEK